MRARIPLAPGTTVPDLIRQGVATGTAWRAVQRGYLTQGYHTRTVALEGEDRLATCLGSDGRHLRNLAGAVVKKVIWSYGLEVATVGEFDQGRADFEDLVQAGILRCLELRAHPHGSKAWYGAVIANETKATLHRVRQRRRIEAGGDGEGTTA